MKSFIFWDITPCSPLKFNRRLGGKRRLQHQGRISRAINQRESRPQAEQAEICSSETSVHFQRTTRSRRQNSSSVTLFVDMWERELHLCWCKRQSHPSNRPWRPVGLWDVEAPTFSRQSAHRWRWGCQPHAPTALYPQEDSWYSFVRCWVDPRAIVRLEGLGQLKNPMTSSGIDEGIFPLYTDKQT
jgi:hypothetical protein